MSALFRRVFSLILIVALLPVAGCGYLIFNERVGQPDGKVDWGIFALDAVGLLFGIIPGVIAFAVDFSTGCIYLPSSASYGQLPAGDSVLSARLEQPAGWELVATVPPFASEAEVNAALQRALAERPALQAALANGAIEWRRELPQG